MVGLSLAEQRFIQGGIAQNLRSDGRGREDFRSFSIESGVIPQANGSARVRIGSTDVIATVKADLGKPSPYRPDQGKVEISIECSSIAAPEFERRGGDELSMELSGALQRSLLGGKSGAGAGIDLSNLKVVEGKFCWDLYIEGLVLSSDGNLLDAFAMAIKVAETRFASHTIVLRRLVRVKEALCQMVISNKWGGWKQVDTEKAKIVKDLIFSDDFWNRVEYALELTEPLISMLRYADTDEPCLGNIYDAMDSMLERMKSAALSNTCIPKVEVRPGSSAEQQEDVDISDEEFSHLDTSGVPVIVTLTKVGMAYIVDATLEEESQMSSAVSVSINKLGRVCGLTKRGGAGLDPSVVLAMISVAKHVGQRLITLVDSEIAAAEARMADDQL